MRTMSTVDTWFAPGLTFGGEDSPMLDRTEMLHVLVSCKMVSRYLLSIQHIVCSAPSATTIQDEENSLNDIMIYRPDSHALDPIALVLLLTLCSLVSSMDIPNVRGSCPCRYAYQCLIMPER